MIVLAAAVLGAGGLYGYVYYLQGKFESQQNALSGEYAKFDDAKFGVVQSADEQLRAARYLLDRHTSPSKIFAALEDNTKESVQYTNFSYERRASGNVTLNIEGVTSEFGKVSLQWTQYLRDQVLAEVVMTKIALDPAKADAEEANPNAEVGFSLAANILAENIPYTVDAEDVPIGSSSEVVGDTETATSSSATSTDTGAGDGAADTGTESGSTSTSTSSEGTS